jgi:hypothetical protein
MRDCAFWVADSTMAQVFESFLTRDGFHHSLGCGTFAFDPKQDLFPNSGGNDPGLYVRAHALVAPFARTHRRLVVALDSAWDGSPGAEAIETHIAGNVASIWPNGEFCVIVIDPELEAWVLHDNPHVAAAFRYTHTQPLRQWLAANGQWPEDCLKPTDPKAAVEAICRLTRTPRSAAVYRKVVERVSVRNCVDRSFRQLADTLSAWFPRGQQ